MEVAVAAVIVLGLAFAFVNGFHDSGIIVGNIVATHGLNPRIALALSTVFNFFGALMGQGVAMVVVSELMRLPYPGQSVLLVVAGGLVGALVINIVTYIMALPMSSTHLLLGGLAGAGLTHGMGRPELLFGTSLPLLIVVPVVACVFAQLVTQVTVRMVASTAPKPLYVRSRQVNSIMVAALALVHGSQDAQKIGAVLALVWATRLDPIAEVVAADRPWFLIVLAAAAMATGTWFSGWRVARTVAVRLMRLDPVTSAISNTCAAVVMGLASFVFQLPSSMSFVVVASNVGTRTRGHQINVRVFTAVTAAWLLGIPVAGLAGAGCAWALEAIW